VIEMALNVVEIVKDFVDDAKRIFIVSRKPTNEEFKKLLLIVALGVIVIGVIGFVINLIFTLTGLGN
jgi:protein transport protein SEC61 subunit gamma-like protein